MAVALPDTFPEMGSRLDRQGGRHLYRQIVEVVGERIREGRLPPGHPIPPQRELAELWGVGEVTIRRAMQELASRGLIEARAGSGTVVASGGLAGRRAGATLRIGVAFADLATGYPFFAPVLAGLRDTADRVAVRMFDVPLGGDDETRGHIPSPTEMDGLVMMSPLSLPLLARAQAARLPVALLFSDLADGYSHCVLPDYTVGVMRAVRHLAERGRRRIALVTAEEGRFSTGRWIEAYRGATEALGLPSRDGWIVRAGYAERAGAEAVRRLLAQDPPPDAVIFASDHLARGGLLAAHELGASVPSDLAMVGAGGLLGEDGWTVPLTTIDLGLEEMGRVARRVVEDALAGRSPATLRHVVPTTLQIGGTT